MISIPMSYISSIIGENQYKDVAYETKTVLWKYNSNKDPKKKKKTDYEKQQFPLLEDLQTNHRDFFETYITSSKIKQYQQRADKLMRELCRKHEVDYKYHKSLLYKKRGFRLEKTLIQKYSKQYNVDVVPCEQITRYCTIGNQDISEEISDNCYRIIGKADGFYGDTVIECKCRRNGFRYFYFERIQLALYILGYQKKQGKLIEMYEGRLKVYTMSNSEAKHIFYLVKDRLDEWVRVNIKNVKSATT